MKILHKTIISIVAATTMGYAAGTLTAPAIAQEKAAENKVLAIINGHKITTKEVKLAADDILPHLTNVPPKMRYPFIVEYLIERRLLAQQAIREGMGNNNEYKTRLVFYQAKALRDAYFVDKLRAGITDSMVRAEYDKLAASAPPQERFRARHILVATEKEAKEVSGKLAKGEKFADLAKTVSLDGSKDFGGDLGYFTSEEMVKEFSDAAKALKKGETSKPVKTEFGWHIINLIDRQAGGPRPFEEMKGVIKLGLLRQAVQKKVDELRDKAKIEMIDPGLQDLLKRARAQREAIEKQQAAAKAKAKANKKKPASN